MSSERDINVRANLSRDPRLIGTWITDPSDEETHREYGRVSMRFHPDGTLTYVIHHARRDDVILLAWRTEGTFIVTDQPTQGREERTMYQFSPDGNLLLTLGATVSRYIRG